MRVRTLTACILVFITGLALMTPGTGAQEKKSGKAPVVSDKAQTPRGTGKDENIKNDSPRNDPNASTPAPPNKGGDKTRAFLSQVTFDNYTPWFVRCYVDGDYRGTVGPFDDLTLTFIPGQTRLYARAIFDSGSYVDWGPRVFGAGNYASYTWKLDR